MPEIPLLRTSAALGACLALLVGCTPTGPEGTERDALRAGRGRWEAAGARSYRYTLDIRAMIIGGTPISVEVRDGNPVSVRYVNTGQAVSTTAEGAFVARFDTVEELFGVIEQALERKGRVSAAYDPSLGYPVSADVDPHRNAIDDEFGFRVLGFEVLR